MSSSQCYWYGSSLIQTFSMDQKCSIDHEIERSTMLHAAYFITYLAILYMVKLLVWTVTPLSCVIGTHIRSCSAQLVELLKFSANDYLPSSLASSSQVHTSVVLPTQPTVCGPFVTPDLLSETLSFLSADDLAAVSSVSKTFNQLANNTRLWSKHVHTLQQDEHIERSQIKQAKEYPALTNKQQYLALTQYNAYSKELHDHQQWSASSNMTTQSNIYQSYFFLIFLFAITVLLFDVLIIADVFYSTSTSHLIEWSSLCHILNLYLKIFLSMIVCRYGIYGIISRYEWCCMLTICMFIFDKFDVNTLVWTVQAVGVLVNGLSCWTTVHSYTTAIATVAYEQPLLFSNLLLACIKLLVVNVLTWVRMFTLIWTCSTILTKFINYQQPFVQLYQTSSKQFVWLSYLPSSLQEHVTSVHDTVAWIVDEIKNGYTVIHTSIPLILIECIFWLFGMEMYLAHDLSSVLTYVSILIHHCTPVLVALDIVYIIARSALPLLPIQWQFRLGLAAAGQVANQVHQAQIVPVVEVEEENSHDVEEVTLKTWEYFGAAQQQICNVVYLVTAVFILATSLYPSHHCTQSTFLPNTLTMEHQLQEEGMQDVLLSSIPSSYVSNVDWWLVSQCITSFVSKVGFVAVWLVR